MHNDHETDCKWSVDTVRDWLLTEGRLLDTSEAMIEQLGPVMLNAGAPLWRLRLSMRTLHPLIAAVTHIWEREAKELQSTVAAHGLEQRAGYVGNPLEIIGRTRKPLRKVLGDELAEDEHPVLHDLRARGATDYYGTPVIFSNQGGGIVVFVTDRENGFDETDILQFEEISDVLAPISDAFNQRRVAGAIASAYLGSRTGERVLAGQITRGHIENIDAAILVTDIRDWSGLNVRLGPEKAMELANGCFDIIASAVETNNGEILKFIGDGVLAIFPAAGSNPSMRNACEDALKAARHALSEEPPMAGETRLQFGIGLHCGEVLYGNIGSENRLDFTVLGEAVNMAARVESLCSKLECPLLFSQAFADHLKGDFETVGSEVLKGFEGQHRILTLRMQG